MDGIEPTRPRSPAQPKVLISTSKVDGAAIAFKRSENRKIGRFSLPKGRTLNLSGVLLSYLCRKFNQKRTKELPLLRQFMSMMFARAFN